MLHKCPERFRDEVELPLNPLVGSARSIESGAEHVVELILPPAVEPCPQGRGEDRRHHFADPCLYKVAA